MVVLGAGYLSWKRSERARWARDEAIPEIARLTDEGDFRAAFDLARQARRYASNDSLLRTLTPIFTASYKVTSTPADANVFVRGYDATNEDWQLLGRAPLDDAQLARRPLRWRIEKQGFEPAELATSLDDDYLGTNSIAVTLQAGGTHPDMVFVPGGDTVRSVNRIVINMPAMGPFFIDRYEVTNAAYKEFVDAGGYERGEYWTDLELGGNGAPSSWEEAMALFVDTTGEKGPATWELGSFPEGREQYPVTGISWYEAAAYARFRGKTLPTVYHWAKAALPEVGVSGLPAAIVPLSNYGTAGPAAVGTYQGIGPYGTYDLHGNVGEWTFNRGDPRRAWVLGGSWQDPAYNFSVAAFPQPLLDRTVDVGFRLLQEASDAAPDALRAPIDFEASPDLTRAPATDEVYAAYAQQFSYRPADPGASSPMTLEETNDWVKQRVTLDTGYGERMDVYLFLPKRSRPPHQALVYFPPLDAVAFKLSTEGLQPGNAAAPLDFIVKSGRAFVHPIYKGTFDRFERPFTGSDAIFLQRRWAEWRSDIGRTIDYLESRDDVDAQRIGYVGISFGAAWPLYLPALESRLRVALLLAGGLLPAAPPAPSVDPVHYAPRITMPVLMMNGRFDNTFPTDLQFALFDLLGTPAEHKRQVIVETAGHVVPRSDVLRESVKWLDEYLGPVR